MRGAFNIYQGKDGKIYLKMANRVRSLTHEQVMALDINLIELKDYNHDDFCIAYKLGK